LGYSWAALAQRIANVIAPTLIGMLVAYGSSFNMTTTIINMFMVATLFLVAFIPETEGKQLH
jgi:putative MFS transporter